MCANHHKSKNLPPKDTPPLLPVMRRVRRPKKVQTLMWEHLKDEYFEKRTEAGESAKKV